MAVNEAGGALKDIDHLLAGHTEKVERFVEYRRNKHPKSRPFEVHSTEHSGVSKADCPSVTQWWSKAMSSGATSAGVAAKIGLAMGFEWIVLCGCPMDGSGYFNPEETGGFDHRVNVRIGDPEKQGHRTVDGYRRKMKALADGEFKGRVFSMSGYTREILGAPPIQTR